MVILTFFSLHGSSFTLFPFLLPLWLWVEFISDYYKETTFILKWLTVRRSLESMPFVGLTKDICEADVQLPQKISLWNDANLL